MGTDENAVIAEKIRMIAESKKVSQSALGRMAGISQSAINRYLNGENEIPASKVKAMADVLGISLDELLGTGRLTESEKEFVELFRLMDYESRSLLLAIAKRFV